MSDSMPASVILGGFSSYSRLTSSYDDDWVDRLSHIYTVLLLAIFALFVSGGQFTGNPIECWSPAHFTASFVAYTKSYCWIKNTYYIPMEESIPVEIYGRDSEELTYYQWVPIILLFMAFLFKFPNIVWRLLNGSSGINLDKIVSMTTETQLGSPEAREETVLHIAQYMDRWLQAHRPSRWNVFVRMRQRMSRLFCFLCSRKDGTYLVGLYLLVKLLYLTNAMAQFFVLNGFLGDWYLLYGLEVVEALINGYSWRESTRFPKVTLCDFDIREMANVQRYTVQCVLPINLFNEKIFAFLWFWCLLVAVATACNLLLWLWRVLLDASRAKHVKKYLRLLDEIHDDEDRAAARRFADRYLRDDGHFVLRLVAKNSSDILLADLILHLWKIYRKQPAANAEKEEELGESKACKLLM